MAKCTVMIEITAEGGDLSLNVRTFGDGADSAANLMADYLVKLTKHAAEQVGNELKEMTHAKAKH
ncbi:hypothetical protein AN401_07095 [Zobellella denitrificans]|uniref:Uncharacterized protein n=1 Tax=Zobellella denitrificans TaxID=347534 RepID=A0A291HN95_9GAMM|nr:hypothetical protein [Zobellella denitrificans]ATG73650.1 hypothetical protein AN401_07095 [Zobellella denitrificans]